MDIGSVFQAASAYHREGKYQDAENIYKKMLEYDPNNVHMLNCLGNVLQDQRKYNEAIDCYQRAVQLDPTFAGSYYHLGMVFEKMDQYDKAIHSYEEAIRLDSHFVGSYNNLGNVYRKLDRLDEAISCFLKAIEVHPEFWGSYYNLGEVYQSRVLDDDAIACYKKVLQLNPHHVPAMNNLAVILLDRKHIDAALAYCQQAIQLQPGYGEPHFTKALIKLLLGDFQEGWKEFEWRWKAHDAQPWRRNFSQPQWNGLPLGGRILFVYAEQGVGDEIMFASCIPDVINQTESCFMECDMRLVPLFSRSFPEVKIIGRSDMDKTNKTGQSFLPSFDMVIAIGSLPLLFRSQISCFPQRRSYLIPDPEKVDKWRNRLEAFKGDLRVGISWRGGKDHRSRRLRSVDLERWKEILSRKEVIFVNLQYGECEEDIAEAKEKFGVVIHDWNDADPLKDLDDFASQISALDLVISVDNATVHLAGALGVPVWVLLPYSPNWRWMLHGEHSPWYPSVRLFRQPALGDWEPVITMVSSELLDVKRDRCKTNS